MEKGNLKKGLLNMTMILIPIIIMISIFLFTSEPHYIHVCNHGDDIIEDDVCVTSNGAFYQVTNSNEKVLNSALVITTMLWGLISLAFMKTISIYFELKSQ